MPSKTVPFAVMTALERLGENIRRARVRRRMSQDELADACGISRKTLYALEHGEPGTSLATAFSVLWHLGLLDSTAALADPEADEHGSILEAARAPKRVRSGDRRDAIDNDF